MQYRQSQRRQFLFVNIIVLAVTQLAFATETLPDITVTAPRKSLADQINNPQQLDEDDIGIAHERTITDVIQGFPGITTTKTGGFGQVTALYIRGAGGQGVITLDGMPLLQSLPGLLNLDSLPAEAVQSTEIVRGPDSAYRSFQSLGGSIQLTTQNRQSSGARISVEGGSFGILRETLPVLGSDSIDLRNVAVFISMESARMALT